MNRRQLAFIILVNAVISLAIALLVAWVIEMRRPDLEELAALYTPVPGAILAPTATLGSVAALPAAGSDEPQILVTHTPGEPDQAVQSGEPDAEQIYVVQAGDSLGGISSRFGVTLDELIQANALTNPDFLFAGQRLTIPGNGGAVESSGEGSATAQGRVSVLAVENPGDLLHGLVRSGSGSVRRTRNRTPAGPDLRLGNHWTNPRSRSGSFGRGWPRAGRRRERNPLRV